MCVYSEITSKKVMGMVFIVHCDIEHRLFIRWLVLNLRSGRVTALIYYLSTLCLCSLSMGKTFYLDLYNVTLANFSSTLIFTVDKICILDSLDAWL